MPATILPFIKPPYEAIKALQCSVPESAMTAELLGTERQSHAVQVSRDGLLLTVGYSILEANEIWLSNHRGETSEGILLAHDFNSGLALLKPAVSLGSSWLEAAPLSSISTGDEASILTSDSKSPLRATIFTKQEFAGRWEYLLDEALYTTPLCESWSGAALLNKEGKLCGIGSLALGLGISAGKVLPGNLFIPTELVMPHLEHMALYGETPEPRRPWLGVLVEEHEKELHVVGLYADGPADRAGIEPGHVVEAVNRQAVTTLAEFFRAVWTQGTAGSPIPLSIRDGEGSRELTLASVDRNAFFLQHESSNLN